LDISNLDKVLYPASRFVKEQVIDFYVRAAKHILPHLKNRPVTLKRYPNGIHGEAFWEKDAPGFTPDWVETFHVPRVTESGVINYILINNLPTLVWAASVAAIELHPFLHRVPEIEQPTAMVFDLDPGEGADILKCAEVAMLVREKLAASKLKAFPKVSGSKGIQLWVPLNTPVTYEATKAFAREVAESLHQKHPDLVVAEMAKVLRAGKVFIDWSQNIQSKTTVGVYSLRAKRERPYVSMPVEWRELQRALRKSNAELLEFNPDQALKRLGKVGDLYAPVLKLKQKLNVSERVRAVPKRASRKLEAYAAKRDFQKTAEPQPLPRRTLQGGKRRFVIQKHAASHLHYDFRLELSDTLKSWAVPKGLPLTPADRRSAFAVEDHPLDYLTFEGVIPEGQYGGGTVMVWDIGTYEILDGNYWKGRLEIFLSGSKLRGEWLLEKMEDGAKPRWLITKKGPSVRLATAAESESAVSGRTMEQIVAARDAVWDSNGVSEEPRKNLPLEFIEPMLAVKVARLPAGKQWLYEWKWDGFRAIGVKEGERVRLYSRKGRDQTASFAGVADAIRSIHAGNAILDGEIIAINQAGEVSFQYLQHRSALPAGWHILFCAFDLLHLEGADLRSLPLEQRKERLRAVVEKSAVLFSTELAGSPSALMRTGRKTRREGIVAKRRDSTYQSRDRSDDWRKLQLKPQQEFVVGGFRPKGTSNLELLLVGFYEGKKLTYAGKVRNALNAFNRKELFALLNPLRRDKCPFANLPNSRRDHFGESVTAEEMQDYIWLKPAVVVQVSFAEWTHGAVLRHAEFLGVRQDKEPAEVARETTRRRL